MSRQFRLRATGVVLGALFVVGPLVMNGTAQAEVAGANDLVFSGSGRNMLGMSCVAEHRSEGFTVESGSTVRVVNDTGHDADLQIDGVSKGKLADDASTDVLFRRGRVEVMLKPNCFLAGPSEPAVVTVTTPPPTPPGPVVTPTIDPTTLPSVGTSQSPTVRPTTTRPTRRPVRPHTGVTAPSRPASRTTAATDDEMPQRANPQTRTRTTAAGTDTAVEPTVVPTVTAAPLEGDADQVSSGPVLAAPEIGDDDPGASGAAAEPVGALEPVSQTKSVGLLALAATICLAGVTAGAIRAIVAQRASRAMIA